MAHDRAVHQQAIESGDYADETLFDSQDVTASLIHFADGSHSIRLDLTDRGMSLVLDTPAWLDLDTVLGEVSETEPTLGSGYVTVEREASAGEVGYRVTVQGGDVVGRVSVILLQPEVDQLRLALDAVRDAAEAADTLDHEAQIPGLASDGRAQPGGK
ncbi:MAG: hypothetical protein IT305_14645 [Chloroflexi bacterium]|nr:hypothetical protein [Chloroflexota bacterium]